MRSHAGTMWRKSLRQCIVQASDQQLDFFCIPLLHFYESQLAGSLPFCERSEYRGSAGQGLPRSTVLALASQEKGTGLVVFKSQVLCGNSVTVGILPSFPLPSSLVFSTANCSLSTALPDSRHLNPQLPVTTAPPQPPAPDHSGQSGRLITFWAVSQTEG